MSEGFDPSLLVDGDFVLLRMGLVDALDGDFESAIVMQRIAWRCERTGSWLATRADIMAETRMSEWKVRKALKRLTDLGWLSYRRASPYDPTPVWTLGQASEPPARGGESLHHVSAETSRTVTEDSSITSTENVETKYETPAPTAQGLARAIHDTTKGGVPFRAALGVTKSVMRSRPSTPPGVLHDAMDALYRAGKPITTTTVCQVLDGALSASGTPVRSGRPAPNEIIAASYALADRLEAQALQIGSSRE